jgi:hypothetical protein
MNVNHRRAMLSLVEAPASQPEPTIHFCGHCGARPDGDIQSRVCSSCSFGLILQTSRDAAPKPGDAFIVLDGSLSVCAISESAESLLSAPETEAVNRHVTELLVPADAEGPGGQSLAVAVTWAARGDEGTRTVTLRPANTFGVRLKARISSCGPPRAALIVFD